ncbi:MAG TPA: SulP family inorganic anion transporter [Oligoflexia bacterium]|nr:SulP family inorganic anion transporter [Oligoflexia bacterium]HMR25794.1 SulP family inorganic anion transporter [Oligoflexia bacterium]
MIHTISKNIIKDFTPSLVVFLISLPLSMGVALASGLPPALGLITGIVGGIVVGLFGGAPLQIAGPSAGLAVIIMEMVQKHDVAVFTLIVVITGILQFLGGYFKLGRYFRAVSPAVIRGMLSGIGVLIIVSEIHIMFDGHLYESGLKNLLMIPYAIFDTFIKRSNPNQTSAAFIGTLTLFILFFWEKYKPIKFKVIPGALLSILIAIATSHFLALNIQYIDVPNNILKIVSLPQWDIWTNSIKPDIFMAAIALAFIGTTETLLCANAVARMHNGPATNYNKELATHGVANIICGLLGAPPVTGVISRSTVNVDAGATSKASAVMQAIWILTFILFFPNLLALIPTSSLAAILIYIGFKLLNISAIKSLFKYGKPVIFIFLATIIGIICLNLLNGIIIGLVLSTIKLVYSLSHLEIERKSEDNAIEIILHGSATFLALPQLGQELETIDAGTKVCFHVENLEFIDHACLDLLSAFKHRHEENGGLVELEWDTLFNRYTQGKITTSGEYKLPDDIDQPIKDS